MSNRLPHFHSVLELYHSLVDSFETVLVAPRIRRSYPLTDYLVSLYRDILENNDDHSSIRIRDLSPIGHFRMIYYALISKKTVILHYHWFEFQGVKQLLALPYKLLCISIFRKFNTRIVWTIHNLEPHDRKYLHLHKKLHAWMACKADLLHLHSPTLLGSSAHYLEIDPESSKWAVLKHPEFPAKPIPKADAVHALNEMYNLQLPTDEIILLLFGNISEYKGIDSFITLSKPYSSQFHVLIAGPVKIGQNHTHQNILKAIGFDTDRFHYVPRFIDEEHYAYLLSSADYCVFNYINIHSSGGAAMALSYKKRIIAPKIGIFNDLENEAESLLYSSSKELESIIRTIGAS